MHLTRSAFFAEFVANWNVEELTFVFAVNEGFVNTVRSFSQAENSLVQGFIFLPISFVQGFIFLPIMTKINQICIQCLNYVTNHCLKIVSYECLQDLVYFIFIFIFIFGLVDCKEFNITEVTNCSTRWIKLKLVNLVNIHDTVQEFFHLRILWMFEQLSQPSRYNIKSERLQSIQHKNINWLVFPRCLKDI